MNSIVLLTGGGQNGRVLSRMLQSDRIPFLLFTIGPPDPAKGMPFSAAYLVRLLRRRLAGIGWMRHLWQSRRPRFAVSERFIGRCNSNRMIEALSDARPDYILMMGGGILSEVAIRTASKGVLNAHPGLLPEIRGVDVVRHAVLNDVPIGVSLHYIDEGIDTGRVIRRWLVPVTHRDEHADVVKRADHIANLAMRWAVSRIVAGDEPHGKSQSERFPLCRALAPAKAAQADALIRSGRLLELYQQAQRTGRIADGAELLQCGTAP